MIAQNKRSTSQINLKAHLLRHVFAAHLHHVEAMPLDVIAVMLHEKNVQVTAYYAAPLWQQVLATTPLRIDLQRDVDRARYRNLYMTKAELVERLLSVEQAYAEVHQQLAQLQFQLLEQEHQIAD